MPRPVLLVPLLLVSAALALAQPPVAASSLAPAPGANPLPSAPGGPASAPAPATPPVMLPKVTVATTVWRDFGFTLGGRPKFFLPTAKAKFAHMAVGNTVAPGSAADKAGLRPGDAIEKIDGVAVTQLTLGDAAQKLFDKKIGDRVVLDVRRPGEKTARTVELVIE